MIRVYLGHGASGTAASMAPWVQGLGARGIEAHALELPKRKAEDAVAAFEAQVPDEPGVVVGGHSFGGRVASLAVAGVRVPGAVARAHPYAGLVCLSYPIHRPGAPGDGRGEDRALAGDRRAGPAPVGTSDPFARSTSSRPPCRRSVMGASSRSPSSGTACCRARGRARPDRGVRRRARRPA